MSQHISAIDFEAHVWDKACKRYNTDHPTLDQLNRVWQVIQEEVEDEALNYHGQDEIIWEK